MEYKYIRANREEKANRTGIPDNMKKRFEAFSGKSFDDVRVHYRSQEPARLNALAYTQGTQVYIAPGQDRYLSHELGHVVQQKRGSVPVTAQINGMPVNDERRMESQADEISQRVQNGGFHTVETSFDVNASPVVQRFAIAEMKAELEGETKTVYGKSGNQFGTKSVMEHFKTFHDGFKEVVSPKLLRHETIEDSTIARTLDVTAGEVGAMGAEYIKVLDGARRANPDGYTNVEAAQKNLMELSAEAAKMVDEGLKMDSAASVRGVEESITSVIKNSFCTKWEMYWKDLGEVPLPAEEELRSHLFKASKEKIRKADYRMYTNIYGEWVFRSKNKDEPKSYVGASLERNLKAIKIEDKEIFGGGDILELMDDVSDAAVVNVVIDMMKKAGKKRISQEQVSEEFDTRVKMLIDVFSRETGSILEILKKNRQTIAFMESIHQKNSGGKNVAGDNYQKAFTQSDFFQGMIKNDRKNEKDIVYELRSPYSCAEPNALAIMLLAFEDKVQDKAGAEDNSTKENIHALLDSIKVSVTDYGKEGANAIPPRPMRACPVCSQWVEGRLNDNGVKRALKDKFVI